METIKEFTWQNDKLAKAKEYQEFHSLFIRHLGVRGITYCVSENDTKLYRPIPPPNNIGTPADRARLNQTYQDARRKFLSNFDTALGVLRSFFKTDSYASSLVDEGATVMPPDMEASDWTPDRRFRAAYNLIVNKFAPRDSTDVNLLRREIQELTDIKCGGFDEYIAEFHRLYLALVKANATPTTTEAREWVMKSVENVHLKTFLASSVLLYNPEATYEQIFTSVRTHLKLLGTFDPYKTMNSSPVGKPTVTAMFADGSNKSIRCTKCWRPGHLWKQCTALRCSACNQPFNGSQFCTNFKQHGDPLTRWAPPHLLNKRTTHDTSLASSDKTNPTVHVVTPTTNGDLKAAKRALSVAYQNLKAAKKQKKLNQESS